jgi:hypothetical protein
MEPAVFLGAEIHQILNGEGDEEKAEEKAEDKDDDNDIECNTTLGPCTNICVGAR